MKLISIIFPVYNEQGNLQELYDRLVETTNGLVDYSFEFLFVDDCSSDQTPSILQQLFEKDDRIRIIRFARNCGSHAAIAYGLNHCRGEAAVVLSADLQDPPALIAELIQEWEKGFHVVWGARMKRKGERISRQFSSRMYYALMNWLTNIEMPPLGADIFLADRIAINAFGEVSEKHTSVFMTLSWLGFKQSKIEYVKEARLSGRSKWTLGKKIKLTIDSLLSFSDIPIRYISVLGILTALLGFLYAIFVFWSYVNGSPVEGWSSLIVAILLIGGVQMIMLGVLGEYLWRTYDETRKRPKYVVETIIDKHHQPKKDDSLKI